MKIYTYFNLKFNLHQLYEPFIICNIKLPCKNNIVYVIFLKRIISIPSILQIVIHSLIKTNNVNLHL